MIPSRALSEIIPSTGKIVDTMTSAAPSITSLAERKAAEAARRREAAAAIIEDLRAYALRENGRFVVFGSYAARRMRYDSDLDVLVDFPPETAGAAWRFVEEVCAEHRLPPDLHDARSSRPGFSERVRAQGVVLP